MKKIIYIIIVIIIILIILLSILFIKLEKMKQTNNEQNNEISSYKETDKNIIENKIERVTNRDMFFTVSSCVEKYLNLITQKETEKLYNLLYDEYKQKFNVTEENIYEHIGEHSEYQIFTAKKMYKLEKYSNNKYFVYGIIRDDVEYSDNIESDYYITVIMNPMNGTFSIMPNGFMFSNDVNVEIESNNIEFKVLNYVCYMNKCDIELVIKNNTNSQLNLNDKVYLTNYENEEHYKLLNEENINLLPNEEKKVKLSFNNYVTTPKNIIFNNGNIEVSIPVIKNYEDKSYGGAE